VIHQLEDAYFGYAVSEVTPDALRALERDAALLKQSLPDFPQVRVVIEGHCDERGSAEYNLALGDARARRAAAILEQYGVPAARLEVMSYGKEAPQCTDSNESCWRRNRRAHLVLRPVT